MHTNALISRHALVHRCMHTHAYMHIHAHTHTCIPTAHNSSSQDHCRLHSFVHLMHSQFCLNTHPRKLTVPSKVPPYRWIHMMSLSFLVA